MKRIIKYTLCCLLSVIAFSACERLDNYPGGEVSSTIAIADIRSMYKGDAVTLTRDNMFGASQLVGTVISDFSDGNLPPGFLIVQNYRRFKLRGIAINLGTDAAKYSAGDSVHIHIEGASLDRIDGMLQLNGVSSTADIQVISSNNVISGVRVPNSELLANPTHYESTLVSIVKGGFNPIPAPTETYAGRKYVNDGFGDVILHTESGASFANTTVPVNANFTGIVYTKDIEGKLEPEHRLRKIDDVKILSSEIMRAPIVITGFLNDAIGTDANYEYMQFMATEDIDFSVTPYSVVTTNNAGTSEPKGLPTKGWATGGKRTYKFDLTSGFAAKGTFFYVGGTTKKINGSKSTAIPEANWIVAYGYNSKDGFGFGEATTNLLANSGNAFGISVFKGTEVTVESTPIDVIFIRYGGEIFKEGNPPIGYKITNTDFYDIIDPISLQQQPVYRMGTNTLYFEYPTATNFTLLGGEYNVTLGRWTKARSQTNLELPDESTLDMIQGEKAVGRTKLVE